MRAILFFIAGAAAALGLAATGAPAQTPDLYDMTQVRSLYLTFKQVDFWQQLRNNKAAKIDIKADLLVDGKSYPDIGVRFKGNSSYRGNVQKEPFNLSIDSFNPAQRLYGYKTLNLNNAFLDPTFVREVIAYELFRRYHPGPQANFVKLYINNQYWGVYINVQQANKELLDEAYGENDGNNFGVDGGKGGFQWLGTTVGPYQAVYELKSGDGQTAWPALVNLIDKLCNTSLAGLPQEAPKVLNVDRALWHVALCNVFCHLDSYIGTGKNYYTYQDEVAGVFQMIPWDLNETFGVNGSQTLTQKIQLSPYYQETNSGRPLVSRLLAVPAWRSVYQAHVRTILDESFNWGTLSPLVAKYQALIKNDVLADKKKFYTDAQFTQSVTQDLNLGRTVPGMKPFTDSRGAYLKAHADLKKTVPAISLVSHSPAQPKPTDTVLVNATIISTSGVLLAEVVHTGGVSTLYDDGQHQDGKALDGVFGGSIAPAPVGATVRYYIRAEARGGGMALDPPRAEFVTHAYTIQPATGTSAVKIHEFAAKNDSGIRDEMGEYEDWIELVNTGATSVSLAGYYLTDNLELPTRWAFPAGTTILPGKTLLVWADEDPGDGPLHASFKLSAGGEAIYLFDKDGTTLLDSVTFGAQQADVSTGRPVGYPGLWVTFPSPTPRALNQPEPCGHLAYGPPGPATTAITLQGQGTPRVGGSAAFLASNAPVSTPGYLGLSPAPFSANLGALGWLLLHPGGIALFPIATTSSGSAATAIPVPNLPALAGMTVHFQALVRSGTTGGLSNGVMTRVCP